MTEQNAPETTQEVVEGEGQEPTQGTADVQVTEADSNDSQESFDRAYVERLRKENAERRQREKAAKEELDRIKAEAESAEEERKQAAMSELEKVQTQAEKLKGERDTYESELNEAYARIARMTEEQEVSKALTKAGINAQRVQAAMRLVDFDSLDVDDEGKITGVEDAVKAVKKESPEWFKGAASIGGPTNPGTDAPNGSKSVANMTDEEIREISQRVQFGERVTFP